MRAEIICARSDYLKPVSLYDSRDRLIGVTTPTDAWTYHYDALGDRTSETHNGLTTQYLVDPTGMGTVLGEYNGNGGLVADHYTEGAGLTSRIDASGASSYYDFDAEGSTAGLTGPSGGYVDSYSYLPFGEVSSSTGSVPNPFQYIGQAGVQTEANGLDFMRARFYSPEQGRFINRDPLGLAGGHNPYSYVHNDPVNSRDPSGLVDPVSVFLFEGILLPGELVNVVAFNPTYAASANAAFGMPRRGLPRISRQAISTQSAHQNRPWPRGHKHGVVG